MKVLIHCTKPMLVVHHHPHLMEVPGQTDKPHLGAPHDHHVKVTVKMRCENLEREKDLLLLHSRLEQATETPRRVSIDNASFEQLCALIHDRLELPKIYSIKVEAHDEGAEIIFEED